MIATVILSPSTREPILTHSIREPNTLFHRSDSGVFARGGNVIKVPPLMTKIVLLLCATRGKVLSYSDIVEDLYGDDAGGGPLQPKKTLAVVRSQSSKKLSDLRLSIQARKHIGLELCFAYFSAPSYPIFVQDHSKAPQHWLPRARAMRERGASYSAIADAVGRDISVVYRAINGCAKKQAGKHPYRYDSFDAQKRHYIRKQARRQASETSEPVEQIYARWGCEKVDRSKLWDQRRAAVSAQEAAP